MSNYRTCRWNYPTYIPDYPTCRWDYHTYMSDYHTYILYYHTYSVHYPTYDVIILHPHHIITYIHPICFIKSRGISYIHHLKCRVCRQPLMSNLIELDGQYRHPATYSRNSHQSGLNFSFPVSRNARHVSRSMYDNTMHVWDNPHLNVG